MKRKELVADLIGVTAEEAEDLISSLGVCDAEEEIYIAKDVKDETEAKELFHIAAIERCENPVAEDGTTDESFCYLLFREGEDVSLGSVE